MPDMQARATRIREHVEDVKLLKLLGGEIGVALSKGVIRRDSFARIPRPKRFLRLPSPLPLRLDQMKRILPPRTRHRRRILRKAAARGNGEVTPMAFGLDRSARPERSS